MSTETRINGEEYESSRNNRDNLSELSVRLKLSMRCLEDLDPYHTNNNE